MKFALILTLVSFFIQNTDVIDIRGQYQSAQKKKSDATSFYQLMEQNAPYQPGTIKTYYGASLIIISKFTDNRKEKLSKFKKGVEIVESSIADDNENIESRFIRLTLQENVPKMLGYDTNIEEDKQFIKQNFNTCTSQLKNYIKSYIETSEVFTESDKKDL